MSHVSNETKVQLVWTLGLQEPLASMGTLWNSSKTYCSIVAGDLLDVFNDSLIDGLVPLSYYSYHSPGKKEIWRKLRIGAL